jgi:hypothetical protein
MVSEVLICSHLVPLLWTWREVEYHGSGSVVEENYSPWQTESRETGGRGQGQDITFKGMPQWPLSFKEALSPKISITFQSSTAIWGLSLQYLSLWETFLIWNHNNYLWPLYFWFWYLPIYLIQWMQIVPLVIHSTIYKPCIFSKVQIIWGKWKVFNLIEFEGMPIWVWILAL